MKKNAPLIVGGIVGLMAVGLIYMYLKRMKEEVHKGMDMVHVLVAADDLESGSQITQAAVAGRPYPQKYVGSRAVAVGDAELVMNAKLLNNLQKGQPLFWSDIEAVRVMEAGVAGIITKGMRAVTIPVTETTGLAGLLKPNHKVDILFTYDPALFSQSETSGREEQEIPQNMDQLRRDFLARMHSQFSAPGKSQTATVFQNVLILSTGKVFPEGSILPQASDKDDKYASVTLMMPAADAQMLTYMADQGKLTLLLRNPADVNVTPRRDTITPADFLTFMSKTNVTPYSSMKVD